MQPILSELYSYRDIIVVDSDEDIVANLVKTKRILGKHYKNTRWIGITSNFQNI